MDRDDVLEFDQYIVDDQIESKQLRHQFEENMAFVVAEYLSAILVV